MSKQIEKPKKDAVTVSIEPGCIACGSCEFIAPDVFKVTDMSRVLPCAQLKRSLAAIKEAALMCPVQVITYQSDEDER